MCVFCDFQVIARTHRTKIYEYLYILATAHQEHHFVYVIGKVVVVC